MIVTSSEVIKVYISDMIIYYAVRYVIVSLYETT